MLAQEASSFPHAGGMYCVKEPEPGKTPKKGVCSLSGP